MHAIAPQIPVRDGPAASRVPATPRRIELRGRSLGGDALPAIIVPLVGATPEALQDEVVTSVARRADLLEWRIDFFEAIDDVQSVVETARAIRAAARGLPVLLSRRNLAEGGQPIPISSQAVVDLYAAVCRTRCVDMIEFELAHPVDDIRRLRALSAANGIAMMLSYQNFVRTPEAPLLEAKFEAAEHLGADVAKVAVMARDPQDILTLMEATARASRTAGIPLVSTAMGGMGTLARLVGWVYGSAATYAIGRNPSADGQIPIGDLRKALDVLRRATVGE
jgi:3-dehydroquinate dehydratase I